VAEREIAVNDTRANSGGKLLTVARRVYIDAIDLCHIDSKIHLLGFDCFKL
jgi:hypothetical protein